MSVELWIFCRKQPPSPEPFLPKLIHHAPEILDEYTLADDWNDITLGSISVDVKPPPQGDHWLMRRLPPETRAQVKCVMHFHGWRHLQSFDFVENSLAPAIAKCSAALVMGPDSVVRDDFAGNLVDEITELAEKAREGDPDARGALCTVAAQSLSEEQRVLVGEALVDCLLEARVMDRKAMFDALLALRYVDGAQRLEEAWSKDGTLSLFTRRLQTLRRHSERKAA